MSILRTEMPTVRSTSPSPKEPPAGRARRSAHQEGGPGVTEAATDAKAPNDSKPAEEIHSKSVFTITEAARILGVHRRSLLDWIQYGRLPARREGRKYVLDASVLLPLKVRRERVHGWPRLVDIARKLGIHRNLGESLCRAAELPVEKDLSDDCRIPPEAEGHLKSCLESQSARSGWTRLVDLAEELALPRNVLDAGLRKRQLEFAYDHSGQIILPPESVESLRSWRTELEAARAEEVIIDGRRMLSLSRTAKRAAEKYANRESEAHKKRTEALNARYRHWVRMGLEATKHNGQLFFDEQTYQALVDDVSLADAGRLTGLSNSRLKRWAAKGLITQTGVAPTRKSYSYADLLAAAAAKLRHDLSQRIPVQALPSWTEVAAGLCLPKGVRLERLLELSAGASLQDLRALESGVGLVSAQLWMLVDSWLGASREGRQPFKPAMDTMEHRRALICSSELPFLLAWFARVGEEHFGNVLCAGYRGRVDPDELTAVCGHLSTGGAVRVYDPEQSYRAGEFLLDATGCDLGPVRTVDEHQIEVGWMRRGPLRMRCDLRQRSIFR